MMFTIEPTGLIRMLESTGLRGAALDHGVICLKASQGKLRLECNGTCREANSLVWQDGQCRLAASRLAEVVRRFLFERTVTVDVKYGLMRIRHSAVPILGLCAWTATSEGDQSDFATD